MGGDGDGDPNDELTTGDEPVTPEDWCNNNASKTALQFCYNISSAITIWLNPDYGYWNRVKASGYLAAVFVGGSYFIIGILLFICGVDENCDETVSKQLRKLGFDIPAPSVPPPSEGPWRTLFTDRSIPPGPGFEWRTNSGADPGDRGGAWWNPETGERFTWDPYTHEIPHWDYFNPASGTKGWRIFPDGTIQPK